MKSGNVEDCVLCCREIDIYAVGVCDHPVCYECSSRMRVLCETNECPICRSEIPAVIFTRQNLQFADLFRKSLLFNRKYNIYFEDEKVRRTFESLLINKCNNCGEAFPTFAKLKEHVRRKHELHYCDLCSDNLKIFTFERKSYNRQDLARHKRKGDPDLTSHRGHPLCEFCDRRFVDNDELFRHLRREHFFCHFCDADGLHQYYESYDYLKVHFRTDHYLCEEGDCINEKFTAVFRSEIDLKAHKATQHNRNKTKAEARQARTLDLEFNYTNNRPTTGSSSPRGRRLGPARRNNNEDQSSQRNSKQQQPETEPLNTQSMQDFPYLSEDSLSSSTLAAGGSTISLQSFGKTPAPQFRPKNLMSAEDFPALGPTNVASSDFINLTKKMDINTKQNSSTNVQAETFSQKPAHNVKILRDSKPENRAIHKRNAPNWIAKNEVNFEEDFPRLETKKVPSPPEDTKKTISAHTHHAPTSFTSESVSENLHSSEDQFVVIKNKSKKKKQKQLIDDDEEEDYSQPKMSEPFPSFNTYNLNNQENKDPYKPRRPVIQQQQQQIYRESDTWQTSVSFRKDDFPPLEVMKKPPPGLNIKKAQAPPPGFTTNAPKSSTNLSLSSVASIVGNSVKKTENVNGVSSSPYINYKYQKPPNFQSRNEKLIQTILTLSCTPEKFQEFKLISKNFRCSVISASEYYNKCLELLGEEGFVNAFPELVSLLPDIPKQQELLAVHNQHTNTPNGNSKRKIKLKDFCRLLSCESCNQVLSTRDCVEHECTLEII